MLTRRPGRPRLPGTAAHHAFLRALAAMGALALTLTGCAVDNRAPAAPPRTAGPVPTIPALHAALLKTGETHRLTDSAHGMTIAVPSIDKAPALALAIETVRNATIRSYLAAEGGTALDMSWQLLGSSSTTLGIALISRQTVQGAATENLTALWYDAPSGRVYTSPALIHPASWAAFTAEVLHAASADPAVDRARIAKALAQPANLWGTGPALTFDAAGDGLVLFDTASADAKATAPTRLRVSGDALTGLLSPLGKRARIAATYPSSFTGAQPSSSGPAPDGSSATGKRRTGRPSAGVARDCAAARCVALTFDDGPSPLTSTILTSLRDAGAGATFFAVGGKVADDPAVLSRIALSGSEVQSHGWQHRPLTALTDADVSRQLRLGASSVERASGLRAVLVRPPDGATNQRVTKLAQRQGLVLVKWSVDTRDWESRDASTTVRHATSGVQPGWIILLSDLYDSTAQAVPQIVATLTRQGFTLVPVSELAEPNSWVADSPFCAAPSAGVECG